MVRMSQVAEKPLATAQAPFRTMAPALELYTPVATRLASLGTNLVRMSPERLAR